jgi:hypothetical protein
MVYAVQLSKWFGGCLQEDEGVDDMVDGRSTNRAWRHLPSDTRGLTTSSLSPECIIVHSLNKPPKTYISSALILDN